VFLFPPPSNGHLPEFLYLLALISSILSSFSHFFICPAAASFLLNAPRFPPYKSHRLCLCLACAADIVCYPLHILLFLVLSLSIRCPRVCPNAIIRPPSHARASAFYQASLPCARACVQCRAAIQEVADDNCEFARAREVAAAAVRTCKDRRNRAFA
jgi:hypothetical protein